MPFDEPRIVDEYDGGTQIRSYGWGEPYEVATEGSNKSFKREDFRSARALAILLKKYKNIDLTIEGGVPTQVALDGAPAIAAYLRGAQGRPRSEVAEIMDINEKTVVKYLNRFGAHRMW